MRTIQTACCGLALVSGAPALAQAKPFDDAVLEITNACVETNDSPERVIAICEKAMADVLQLRFRQPTLTQHDENVVLVVTMAVAVRIGGVLTDLDGRRSARVCAKVEESWAAAALLRPEASPSEWAADMVAMRKSATNAVSLCRAEFGMPSGAPPLPN